MRIRAHRHRLWLNVITALLATGFLASGSVSAQLPARIEPLGSAEKAKSDRQRDEINRLGRRYLGTPLRGGDPRDLVVLQRLLDEQWVNRNDTAGQQALGVALGDVMASGLRLQWVVLDDELGRSRALRLNETPYLFFPVTMVSKRMANGEEVDFKNLYETVQVEVERLSTRSQPKRRRRERPARPLPDPILEAP